MTQPQSPVFRLPRILLSVALAAAGIASVFAADWPTFKPGHWQFVRVMEKAGAKPEQEVSTKPCWDPPAENRKQREMLTRAGCKFSPITQEGSKYRYTAECSFGDMKSTSSTVLDATGADSYTVTIESVTNGVKAHEVLTARRLGDCAK